MTPFPLKITHSSSTNPFSFQNPVLISLHSSLPSSTIAYNRRICPGNRSHVLHQALKSVLGSQAIDNESTLSDLVEEFWEWAIKKGAVVPSYIKPGINATEGIGLVAQKDISKKEVVLEVPKSLWINPDTVAASEIGKLCQVLKPWMSIALFLIREKALGTSSPWFHYLSILPGCTNSPIFWSEEELLEIQGTQLLSTTDSVKEYVKGEFIKVEEEIILPNRHLFPPAVAVADFLWAFGILRSRAFSGLRGENLVLIPLADLVNHSPGIATEEPSWEIKAKGLFSRELLFSLWTPVYLRSGEQVYIQYDLKKTNAELALDYGFIESSTSNRETYTLTLEISESDPFYDDKLDVAEANGMEDTAYFDIVKGKPLPSSILPYLRLVALGGTDAFLLESIFRNSIWDHLQLPVSRVNEETICRVVRTACKTALSAYHTTIEEDEKLIEEGNMGPRAKIAVGIRSSEKKVLDHIDGVFRARELELDELEYYQERRLKDLGLVGEQGDIIFWE